MVVKKRAKKREIKRVIHKSPSRNIKISKPQSHISIVIKNLFLFIVLSGISYLLYAYFFKNAFLISLFYVMSMIFGFMAVGFFITFLVLLTLNIIKVISKKNVHVKSTPVRKGKSKRKKKLSIC
jgi:magnesium-transporting ATPase (P-type)